MANNYNESSKALFKRVKVPLDNERKANYQFNSEIDFPHKGIKIINASSDNAYVELAVNWPHDRGDLFPMRNGDMFNFPEKVNGAKLVFSAQPGAWVEFLVSIETNLPQTNTRLNITGALKQLDGASVAVYNAAVDITTVEAQLIPQNLNRGFVSIENNTGLDLFVGNTGYCLKKLPTGGEFQFKNTAALFAKTSAGTALKNNIVIWEESY